MDASLLASVLSQLAAGGRAELAPDEIEVLRAAVSAGLLVEARPDPAATTELTRLRAELAAARGTPRQDALRSEILRLSDRLAESSGGVEVAMRAEGAYRGASSAIGAYHLTHPGRALLGDLGPRVGRVRGMRYDEFLPALQALKGRIDERARRAREVMGALGEVQPLGASRLAALGVAARAESAMHLGLYLKQAFHDTTGTPLTPAERWSAAESAVLATGRLEDTVPVVRQLVALRNQLFSQYAHGRSEDALDAAVLLLPWPEEERAAAIQRAAGLATHVRNAANAAVPLSTALVVERARPGGELSAARMVSLHALLAPTGAAPDDAVAAAAFLSLADADPAYLVGRTESLLGYVSRFSPTPLWAAAAALALLDGDVSAIVDDLRLTSAATQRHLGAGSGAEAIGLAIKLLLLVATLGLGSDGDAEESLALRPRIAETVRRLGMAGLTTSLPAGLPIGAAFHSPLLTAHDVALAAAPMHDSYVFGSGGGYGTSGWGGGHRSYRSWG